MWNSFAIVEAIPLRRGQATKQRVREGKMIALARLPSRLCAASLLAAAAILSSAAAAAEGTIRIAFGDIATVESLHFLVALERARERGADRKSTRLNSSH